MSGLFVLHTAAFCCTWRCKRINDKSSFHQPKYCNIPVCATRLYTFMVSVWKMSFVVSGARRMICAIVPECKGTPHNNSGHQAIEPRSGLLLKCSGNSDHLTRKKLLIRTLQQLQEAFNQGCHLRLERPNQGSHPGARERQESVPIWPNSS